MTSEDKKSKSGVTPKKEAAAESKISGGTEAKTDGGESAASAPAGYSRGEGQKPVSKAYRDNWKVIFGKRAKRQSR
jgi:hypothetical protein